MYPTDHGLVSLGSYDAGELYAWEETEVWYDPTRKEFWVYEGGGCSCNEPYDYYQGKADLNGPYPSLARALRGTPPRLKELVTKNWEVVNR